MKFVVALACLGLIAISNGSPSVRARCPTDPSACTLPNCLCADTYPPNGLDPTKVPQIVFLTFDDAINTGNHPFYKNELFDGSRTNPNGAPISGTFFVTHQYNDYTLTNDLYRDGHEIALHSITHRANQTYWSTQTEAEAAADIVAQKGQLERFAAIPSNEIVGFRAPFLQLSGDATYRALAAGGLKYDSTRPTWQNRPYLWPYTADYDTIQDCQISPCPQGNYPGFWVFPLVDLLGSNGYPCAFVDTCLDVPQSEDEAYNLLLKNFNDHYTATRAPFGIYTHAAWISNEETPWIKTGYLRFIDEILKKDDVYIVSIKKALDYIQSPVTLDDVTALPPSWGIQNPPANRCIVKYTCTYNATTLPGELSGERLMASCVQCPARYPWLGNALGDA